MQRSDDQNRIGFLLPCSNYRKELLVGLKTTTQARVRSEGEKQVAPGEGPTYFTLTTL